MTIQVLCEKLLCCSLLGMSLSMSPLMAQNYQGSSNYLKPGPRATTELVMNLTISGTAITGAIGIGSTVASIPASGTKNGQICTVGMNGGITYTGVCTPTSFSGTYSVGAQSGTFSLTASGAVTAPFAAPTAAPATAVAAPVRAAATRGVASPVGGGAPAPANGVVSWLAAPPGATPAAVPATVAPVAARPAAVAVAKPIVAAPPVAQVQQRAANPVAGGAAVPAVAANGVVGWLAAPPQAQPPPPVVVPWLAATGGPAQGVTPIGTGQQGGAPPAPTPPPVWTPVPVGPPTPTPPVGPAILPGPWPCGVEPGNAAATGGAGGLCNGSGSRPAPTPVPVPPVPPPAPVPPTPPGEATCPISSPMPQLYQGTLMTAGGVQEPIAFNLQTEGGTVGGMIQVGLTGLSNTVSGTRVGQLCSVRTNLGAVFQGICDGKTFNGTYNTAAGPMHFATSLPAGLGTTWTTACGAGPQPLPAPTPVPAPVVCPAAAAQAYRGTAQFQDNKFGMTMDLVFNGANITGMETLSSPGTLLVPTNPLTGTRIGDHCTLNLGGIDAGRVLDGTCVGHTFSGTIIAKGFNMLVSLTDTTPAATVGCVAPTPPNHLAVGPPVPGPVPQPVTPQVWRYCGMFGNVTAQFSGAIEFDLAAPGTWTNAQLIIGQPLTSNVHGDFGGGAMSGSWAPTCAGQSTAGFEITWAKCSATEISGNYKIMGGLGVQENGTFDATYTTAAACPEPK